MTLAQPWIGFMTPSEDRVSSQSHFRKATPLLEGSTDRKFISYYHQRNRDISLLACDSLISGRNWVWTCNDDVSEDSLL